MFLKLSKLNHLIKKIMNLNKKELGIFSKNAKNYFDRNFLRKKIMIKIEEILEEAIRPA